MVMREGLYKELCDTVQTMSCGRTCMVLVLDGIYGSGYSIESKDPRVYFVLPQALEDLARRIRAANN